MTISGFLRGAKATNQALSFTLCDFGEWLETVCAEPVLPQTS